MEIEITNLTKKYKDFVAVDNLNLSIKKKQLFSLLGVNGAGKTTTIKMLTCLIKPTSGKAFIDNKDITKDQEQIKKIINISPQETAIALNLTVIENLYFVAGVYEINNKDAKIKELIAKFKLETVKNKKVKLLSGGYQRRLSIAMSLINDPKILFLDEPTLGLDVLARRELWNVIKELKNTSTIILTTHYMEEALELSDEIGIMNNGRLIDCGSPNELMKKTKSKNMEDAFVKIVAEGGKNENTKFC